MALAGLEVVVIGVVLLAMFILGPKKIPELAAALGKAKKAFKDASENVSEEKTEEQ